MATMVSTRPNPLLIPTLTEVVSEGSPALDPQPEVTPEMLAARVWEIVHPQIAEIVQSAIVQALEEQKRLG